MIEITVRKIHRLPEGNKIKAFADVSFNDVLLVKGIRLIDGGKRGLFVSMPQEMGKDERWYEKVRILDINVQALLTKAVLSAYYSESEAIK